MPVYVAIAYRYGRTNGEWFIVHAGTCLETVDAYAHREVTTSAGKYGVEIREIDEDRDERIRYIPSAYQEKEPSVNRCIAIEKKLGSYVLSAIEDERKRHEIPDWLLELYHKSEAMADAENPNRT